MPSGIPGPGAADYPIAMVDHPTGSLASVKDAETISRYAADRADQVEGILFGRS